MKVDKFIVASDLSEGSAAAFRSACHLGRRFGATVEVVHVLEDIPSSEWVYYGVGPVLAYAKRDLDAARSELEEWIARVRGTDCPEVSCEIRSGDVVTELNAVAASHPKSVLVVGTTGHSPVGHALLGSVAERVVRHSEPSVITVHKEFGGEIRRILAPVDLDEPDLYGVPMAESIRDDFQSELDFLFVFRDPEHFPIVTWKHFPSVDREEFRDQAKRRVLQMLEQKISECVDPGPEHHFNAIIGKPQRVIPEHAERTGADLIVMATHGRTGLTHTFLGSVAERVVRRATCPVWTLKRACG